jgi:hypothetical protein
MHGVPTALIVLLAGCGSSAAGAPLGVTPDAGADAPRGDAGNLPDARDAATPDSSSGAPDAPADSAGWCPVACDPTTSYCQVSEGQPLPDGGADPPSYDCVQFDPQCEAGPSCECAEFISPYCTCAEQGNEVTQTCPFHL